MVKLKAISGETKGEKFKRIAANRTQKVLRYLKRLGNCANTGTYSYSKEDVNKIFGAIDRELKRVRMLFDKPKESEFSL